MVFHPLYEFEVWLKDVDRQNKLLSRLSKCLSFVNQVLDTSRVQWQMNLNTLRDMEGNLFFYL